MYNANKDNFKRSTTDTLRKERKCKYKKYQSHKKNKNRNGTDAKPYFILAISNIYARTYKLLKVLWTARRSNQLILKEINPEYSLEGLMLKLKRQYFGHLM